jgi:hypothetical protein
MRVERSHHSSGRTSFYPGTKEKERLETLKNTGKSWSKDKKRQLEDRFGIWVPCYIDVSRSRFLPRSQRNVTRMFSLIHCPNGGILLYMSISLLFYLFFFLF